MSFLKEDFNFIDFYDTSFNPNENIEQDIQDYLSQSLAMFYSYLKKEGFYKTIKHKDQNKAFLFTIGTHYDKDTNNYLVNDENNNLHEYENEFGEFNAVVNHHTLFFTNIYMTIKDILKYSSKILNKELLFQINHDMISLQKTSEEFLKKPRPYKQKHFKDLQNKIKKLDISAFFHLISTYGKKLIIVIDHDDCLNSEVAVSIDNKKESILNEQSMIILKNIHHLKLIYDEYFIILNTPKYKEIHGRESSGEIKEYFDKYFKEALVLSEKNEIINCIGLNIQVDDIIKKRL